MQNIPFRIFQFSKDILFIDLFAFLVVILNGNGLSSAPLPNIRNTTSASTQPLDYDCNMKAQKVGTALGSLLLVETLFCCYVLFSWVRNFR
jgi:hypothetical protein